MSNTSRWPTSRSAWPTPWCVYSERPVTSIETAGEDGAALIVEIVVLDLVEVVIWLPLPHQAGK